MWDHHCHDFVFWNITGADLRREGWKFLTQLKKKFQINLLILKNLHLHLTMSVTICDTYRETIPKVGKIKTPFYGVCDRWSSPWVFWARLLQRVKPGTDYRTCSAAQPPRQLWTRYSLVWEKNAWHKLWLRLDQTSI